MTEDLLGPAEPADVSAQAPPVRRFWARLRGGETIPGLRTLKVTVATVLAYVAADMLPGHQPPVVAALTALLVVQLTPYQTVKTGWRRIGSVVSGVLLAALLSSVMGLTWWSLGVTVLGALIVAHVLRLGDHAVEVPISAMLVLAVAGSTEVGLARVYETMVGAAVGILVSLLTPRTYVQPAGDAIGDLGGEIGQLLRSVASDLEDAWTPELTMQALRRARELEDKVIRARSALVRAEESVRLNPRGRRAAHIPDTLRPGLTALEYAAINLRVMCRSLVDRVVGLPERDLPGPEVRRPLARLLAAAADAVTEFGKLVASDVAGPAPSDDDLRRALHRARTRRDAASRAMLVDAERQPAIWRVHGALLAHTDRLLAEIDPDAETVAPSVTRLPPAKSSSTTGRRFPTSMLRRRTSRRHAPPAAG